MADYRISDIYQGGYSSLDSGYGPVFTGYRAPVSKLGVSTDPRTANILKEISEKIAPGEKVIELSIIDLGSPIEAIPKQHFDEARRLSKLAGVEITQLELDNEELGVFCRKNFFISVLGVST